MKQLTVQWLHIFKNVHGSLAPDSNCLKVFVLLFCDQKDFILSKISQEIDVLIDIGENIILKELPWYVELF